MTPPVLSTDPPVLRSVQGDWAACTDPEQIGVRAELVVTDVRRFDPAKVRETLAVACATEPVRMAQILMTLGAWVNDEEPLSARGDRVETITAIRAQELPGGSS